MNGNELSNRSRLHWLPILAMLISLPFLAHGILHLQSDTTDMSQWLADSQPNRQQYAEFVAKFGPDDFVIVSWPGCSEQDHRLAAFVAEVRNRRSTGSRERLIRRVISGPELLERLTAEPVSISRDAAVARLGGTMMSSDGATQCALVEVTEEGNRDPHGVIAAIQGAAADCGISGDELRIGGGIYEAVHIDLVSQDSFRRYVGWSAGLAMLVALISLRSVGLTLIVIMVGAYCGCLSVALVHFAGMRINVLMLILPTLVYVLVISGAIHLVNYYLDEVRQKGQEGAASRAIAVGWLPCTLASVTTAIGMMSLAVSQIGHVRSFGVFSAIALLLSLGILLAFVPAALALFGARIQSPSSRRAMISDRVIDQFADTVIRHCGLISLGLLLAFVGLGIGLGKTASTVKLERMFAGDDQMIRNYRWLESNIGQLAAIEILVTFDRASDMSMIQQLALLGNLSKAVEQNPEVGKTFFAGTLMPASPQRSGLGGAIRRAVFNKRLESAVAQMADDRVLYQDSQSQVWRLTARITALREIDHDGVVRKIDQQVRSVLKQYYQDVQVQYVGSILAMSQGRQQLLDDLVKTFAAAFVLICTLMMVILHSFIGGIVSMIPNLVPAVAVFGAMGWFGVPVEIGTVLTACVALGIAVDDTLHFLTWYRRGIRDGKGRFDAIRLAYRRCTVAMIQTTMICGLGLLVFAASDFVPTSRFAVLMFALLATALVGDLIFLPALLAGPLGRYFQKHTEQTEITGGAGI